jgi:death on curing protein
VRDEQAEPIWLSWRIVDSIHLEQILQHGGSRGVRDRGLIESALARPVNKWQYEGTDGFALAAAYGFGIAKNHGFEDGNKRTAFVSLYTFLGLNGYDLDASEPEVVSVVTALADGTLPEAGLADWIRDRARESP